MRKVLTLFCSSLLLFGILIESRADIARPSATPARAKLYYSEITVEGAATASDARLQISQATLKQLQAALAELPDDSTNKTVASQISTRTVVAGLSLFLAIAFGGVWLFRSGSSRGPRTAAVLLIGGALFGAAAILTRGNAGPPPAYRWRGLTRNLTEGRPTNAGVMIEVVPDGNGIKLMIPLKPANTSSSSDE